MIFQDELFRKTIVASSPLEFFHMMGKKLWITVQLAKIALWKYLQEMRKGQLQGLRLSWIRSLGHKAGINMLLLEKNIWVLGLLNDFKKLRKEALIVWNPMVSNSSNTSNFKLFQKWFKCAWSQAHIEWMMVKEECSMCTGCFYSLMCRITGYSLANISSWYFFQIF